MKGAHMTLAKALGVVLVGAALLTPTLAETAAAITEETGIFQPKRRCPPEGCPTAQLELRQPR
jgi:hypothetical protein